MNNFTAEQLDYLNWIKRNIPLLYADRVQPFLSNAGLGALADDVTDSGGLFSSILDSITTALPALATTYATVAGTQAALNQKTAQLTASTKASSTNTMLYVALGGVALLGVFLLARK